jgi:hypothetical protein
MLEGDAGLVGGQAQRQLVGTLDVGLVLAGTGEGGLEFATISSARCSVGLAKSVTTPPPLVDLGRRAPRW